MFALTSWHQGLLSRICWIHSMVCVCTCECVCALVLDLDKGVSGRAKWQMTLFLSCPCIPPFTSSVFVLGGRIGHSSSVCAGFEVRRQSVVIPRELWFMCSVPHLSHYQEMEQHASDLLFRRELEASPSQDHCVCLSSPRVHLSSGRLTSEHAVSRSVVWSITNTAEMVSWVVILASDL